MIDIPENERNDILQSVNEIGEVCKHFNLDISRSARELQRKAQNPEQYKPPMYIYWRDVRTRILDELSQHSFMYIPETYKEFYNHEALFGDIVYEKFPSAGTDIESAGNCYATGNYTACVFHLMRAVEIGLVRG